MQFTKLQSLIREREQLDLQIRAMRVREVRKYRAPVLISGITHWLVQALCRTLNRRREMNEVKRNQIRAIAFAGLQDAVKNGFNGAISAGGGSFNDLCGKIALRTGADFQIVQQIVAPIWDDMLEYVRIPGLDQYENWHEWNIPART